MGEVAIDRQQDLWRPDGRYDDPPVVVARAGRAAVLPDRRARRRAGAGLLRRPAGVGVRGEPCARLRPCGVAPGASSAAIDIQSAADEARVRLFFEVGDLDRGEEVVRSLGGTVGERYEWGPMEAVACTDDQGTRFVLSVGCSSSAATTAERSWRPCRCRSCRRSPGAERGGRSWRASGWRPRCAARASAGRSSVGASSGPWNEGADWCSSRPTSSARRRCGSTSRSASRRPTRGSPSTATPERVEGSMDWAPERCTTAGLLHGGALMSPADSVGAVCAF